MDKFPQDPDWASGEQISWANCLRYFVAKGVSSSLVRGTCIGCADQVRDSFEVERHRDGFSPNFHLKLDCFLLVLAMPKCT